MWRAAWARDKRSAGLGERFCESRQLAQRTHAAGGMPNPRHSREGTRRRASPRTARISKAGAQQLGLTLDCVDELLSSRRVVAACARAPASASDASLGQRLGFEPSPLHRTRAVDA